MLSLKSEIVSLPRLLRVIYPIEQGSLLSEVIQTQELLRRAVKKTPADLNAEEWIKTQKYAGTDGASSVLAHHSYHFTGMQFENLPSICCCLADLSHLVVRSNKKVPNQTHRGC